jgi:hypothetical protein
VLDSRKTLAVILGVSDCPRAPSLQPLPQCRNSADAFEAFLCSDLGLSRSNVINLFDLADSASDQLDKIEDWLADRVAIDSKPTDLIVYYSGHGGFTRNDQAYFLAIQKTRAGSEGATSIRYIDLASALKRHAQAIRKYLILDCCFAASAVFGVQSDLAQLVIRRVEDELPPSGTAVLCSSSAELFSIAPPGERYTMFSGALLDCLVYGIPGSRRYLSLEDVGKRTRELIVEKFPSDFVRPELHVPEQTHGNLAQFPLFPNPQWKQIDESVPPKWPVGDGFQKKAWDQLAKNFLVHAYKRPAISHKIMMGHKAECIDGEIFIRAHLKIEIKLYEGEPERFAIASLVNPRIVSHSNPKVRAEAHKLVNLSPRSDTLSWNEEGTRCEGYLDLKREAQDIEYEFEMLETVDGVYFFNVRRFTEKVEFTLGKAPELTYEHLAIGGFPALGRVNQVLATDTWITANEPLVPNQGLLLQWYRKRSA